MNNLDEDTGVHHEVTDHIRFGVFYVGIGMVIAGAIALLYLGVTVLQIIDAPEKAGMVQWLITTIGDKELVLSGSIDNARFQLHASDTLQYLLFGIFGFVMIRILVSIVNTLIAGGIKLILLASPDNANNEKK